MWQNTVKHLELCLKYRYSINACCIIIIIQLGFLNICSMTGPEQFSGPQLERLCLCPPGNDSVAGEISV